MIRNRRKRYSQLVVGQGTHLLSGAGGTPGAEREMSSKCFTSAGVSGSPSAASVRQHHHSMISREKAEGLGS